MLKKLTAAIVVLALAATSHPVHAGGWSVLTLDELPSGVVVDRPVTIGFVLRQHGQNLMPDMDGRVIFERASGGSHEFPIHESGARGHYTATFSLPAAGVWQWRIEAFGEHAMPPLTVLTQAPGRATAGSAPAAQAAALGKDLFVAKGCWQCHAHQAVRESGNFKDAYGVDGAPDLSRPQHDAAYLRAWLKDPKALKPNTSMPNLGLKAIEIEALIAFLKPQPAASCRATAGRALASVESAPVRSSVEKGHVLSGVIRSSNGCAPMAGARIVFLLANPQGEYDDAHRATVFADANGAYRFESNFPGQYEGSPAPHIHLQVSAPGHRSIEAEYMPRPGATQGTFDVTLAAE